MDTFKNYTQTGTFKELKKIFHSTRLPHLKEIPYSDKNYIDTGNILVDFSKTHLPLAGWDLYKNLLNELNFAWQRAVLFEGKYLNITENRPALHMLFRDESTGPFYLNGVNLKDIVDKENKRLRAFVEKFRNGERKGVTGKTLKTIVHVGIGGSHLGPQTVLEALDTDKPFEYYFLHNVDDQHAGEILNKINIQETLFIVVSKSFGTAETLTNARRIKEILEKKVGNQALENQMIAVTSDSGRALDLGINPENIFYLPVWVGGRFSVWSPVGITVALVLGWEKFEKFRHGAYLADLHFRTQSVDRNIPVILALITFLYGNLLNFNTEIHIPYREKLKSFPFYLQQLTMESNGKSVQRDGTRADYKTSPFVWGFTGTDAQHSFFQMLHQGKEKFWLYFYGTLENAPSGFTENKKILLSNLLAQAEALAYGRKGENAFDFFEGNKPSVTFLFKELNAESLGFLLAVFEHKIFTESVLWNINAFDQPGVELGKQLAKTFLENLNNQQTLENPSYEFIRRNI